MSSPEHIARYLAAAAPAVVPATAPAWGPPVIELFGTAVPVMSMGLSLAGLMMARGVSAAREGRSPGGGYLTGTLAMILVALVLERQPTPGMAIAWGIGIGASGILLFDLVRDWFMDKVKLLLPGKDK
jgi:hypothetical protein